MIIALAIFEILDQYPLFRFCSDLSVRARVMSVGPGALIETSLRIELGRIGVNLLSLCRNRANFHVIQVDLLISGPESAIVTKERFI